MVADEERSYAFRKSAEAVKTAVSPARYIADQGIEAKHLHTDVHKLRCVAPDHEDPEPSMYIYGAKVHCYGCGFHDDVIGLAFVVEDHGNMFSAMTSLADRYGVDIETRPDSWFAKQRRQQPMRDAIEDLRVEHVRRRCFRVWGEPLLANIEDAREREEEANELWRAVLPPARRIYEGLRT